ncbi:MAG: Hpt domain-containing protein [Gammaproteobacteria bacterium]|jgi:chemosensory pili system protein ChpA (sensor histidine kinase/response regulator)
MNQVIDFGTLSWVKNELDEALREARQSLEAHVETPDVVGQADVLVTRLHQVCGTLRMVELHGASMLAEEMERVARAIRDGSASPGADGCEVLMRAILQLPDYLDRLIAGQRDIALVLLPVLNDLRAVRGEKPLSEIAMFAPDVTAELPETAFEEQADGDIQSESKALRHRFQRALVGWFRGQDLAGSLNTLTDVLNRLQALSRSTEARRLWWVAGGIVDAVKAEALESSVAVNRAIGQLDRHIKGITEVGEATLLEDSPDELLRDLLFYIARSRRVEGRVAAIRAAYHLDDLLPGEEQLAAARKGLSGQNSDLFATVAGAIKEELGRLKDSLDLIRRGGGNQTEKLQPLIDSLRALGDTLGMLGMDALRKSVISKVDDVASYARPGETPPESLLMDIASTLLSVELSVDRMGEGGTPENTADQPDGAVTDAESSQLMQVVLHEAMADLVRAKEAIVAYTEADNDWSLLSGVPQLLNQVKGGLTLIGEERAAALTASAARYVRARLIESETEAPRQELDSLADCICGIEYYLETRRDRQAQSGSAILLAEQSIERLAYGASEESGDLNAVETVPSDEPEDVVIDDIGSAAGSDIAEPGAAREEGSCVEQGRALIQEIEQASHSQSAIQAPAVSDKEESLSDQDRACAEDVECSHAPEAARAAPAPADDSGRQAPEAALAVLGDDIDEEILEIFLEEAEEETASIDEQLSRWLRDPQDSGALATLRRSFHTLKGSGRLIGAMRIGELAWVNENMLNRVIDGSIAVSPALMEVLQGTKHALAELLCEIKDGTEVQQPVAYLMRCAERLSEGRSLPESGADDSVSKVSVAESHARTVESIRGAGQAVPTPLEEESVGEAGEPIATAEESLSLSTEAGEPSPARTSGTIGGSAPGEGDSRLAETTPEDENTSERREPFAEDAGEREPAQILGADESHASPDPYAACDPELIELFVRESEENLETSDTALRRWRQCVGDNQALGELRRALHTLKGAARMVGFNAVGNLAHAVESQVIAMAEGHAETGSEAFDRLQNAHDHLVSMLEQVRERRPVSEAGGVIEQLEVLQQPAGEGARSVGEAGSDERAFAGDTPDGRPAQACGEPYGEGDPEILEVFLEEAGDILEHIDETLQAWRQAPDRHDLMSELQRELHTLKGGARMADITVIGDLAHGVESLMTRLTEGEVEPQGSVFAILEEAHDRLAGMVDQVRRRQPIAGALDILDRLESLRAGEALVHDERPVEEPSVRRSEQAAVREQVAVNQYPHEEERRAKSRGSQELVRIKANLLDNLVNFAGEVSIYRSRLEQQVGAYRFNLIEMDQTIARLRDQLRKLEIETEAQILFRYEREELNEHADFDPLEMDRYSKMQQLSRSLIESVGDLASIQHLLENITRESETLLLQQSRVNTELQERLMRTRMVPFLGLAARMRRIVRQTCHELGKQAELELSGADGEMDRTVVDRIIAPIEHMLRNAISHGIEFPRQRLELGKPETGTIRLTLERESSDILLKISDDGAGINPEAVRKKAVERGLMEPDAELSDTEILQFIVETGISTAEKVTQVAGRGVGMDVVNSEVKQLGGSLSIDSEAGRGTTFTVRLPFTLALNQALLVEVGEDVYAIPLASIEGVVRMSEQELSSYYADPDARFNHGGMMYELCHLGSMLGTEKPRAEGGVNRMPVLLARTGDRCVGFQVENLLGSREIVVKSVGPQVSTVRGITGATILGDGRVVMILDVTALLRGATPGKLIQPNETPHRPGVRDALTVMIVDDSITMRKVTTRLLERNDMKVMAAKDGVDAVAKLQEQIPDILLLDIEMPRMDGFELATHVRNEARLHHIPIIMITSRSGDKHRQRAMQIGVNRYLGKPFQEADLLENIHALLEESGARESEIDG